MVHIKTTNQLSVQEEIKYKNELGDDYAPLDEPIPYDENTIGFDFLRYPTLHKMALSDARIKMCIGPAGCLDRDTEVLTPKGWVSIAEAPKVIMCYDPDNNTADFSEAEHVKYDCPEGFHLFKNKNTLDMAVSDEHKVWYQTGTARLQGRNDWHIATGAELAAQWKTGSKRCARIPTVFNYVGGKEYPLTDDEIRVCVMVAADGYLPKTGRKVHVSVNREHKKERIRELLLAANIIWREDTFKTRPNTIRFVFTPPEWSKDLTRFYGCTQRQLQVIADESLYWDGTINIEKGSKFTTSKRDIADFMQFAYVATGTPSTIKETIYTGSKSHWAPTYIVSYRTHKQSAWAGMANVSYDHIESVDGKKYCYHTNTGMFVVRRNGKVFITGNSAKTSGIIWQIIIKALEQAPASDGVRYSKCVVARNTSAMLKSTTIQSFKVMAGNLLSFRTGSFPMQAFLRADLSDGTKVSLDIEFLSFDDEKSQNKLLGCEPTFAFVDEVSELPESLILAINRRLGRFPSGRFGKPSWVGLLGATNGPMKNHWLYQWYMGKTQSGKPLQKIADESGRPYFELFRQPPALLKQPDGTWKRNVFAENVENLPDGYGYYISMLNDPEEKINAYVLGEFSDIRAGKVVFPEFNDERHILPQFNIPYGAPLYLAFDFGRTPVCLIATATAGGRLIVIDEVMGEDMSIDTLIAEHVKPVLRKKYPQNLVEGAWGDPSGISQAQSVDVSPFDVLLKHGIPIESPGTNKIQPRIEAVKQQLKQLDGAGQPMLQITDNCKYLIEAIKYNYIYENVRGKNDVVRDVPTKSHEGWVSDLCDSLQYLVMGHTLISRVRSRPARTSSRRARFI